MCYIAGVKVGRYLCTGAGNFVIVSDCTELRLASGLAFEHSPRSSSQSVVESKFVHPPKHVRHTEVASFQGLLRFEHYFQLDLINSFQIDNINTVISLY